MTNKKVFRQIVGTRKLILTTRKKQLKFLGGIMRKECLETLTFPGHIEKVVETVSNLLNEYV